MTTEPSWQPLQTAAERIRGLLDDENKRRRGQDIRRNIAIGVSLVIALFSVVVAFATTASLRTYQADTAQARVASCKQYNVQQERSRAAFKDTAEILVAQVRNPTPAQKVFIDRYRAQTAVRAVINFPDRDCTPAGIEKYLGQQ